MEYAELVRQWRLRAGLGARREGCAVDYVAGIDIDALLHRRIADWYVRLVNQGHTEVLVDRDISAGLQTGAVRRNLLKIVFPEDVLSLTELTVDGHECAIVDAGKSARLAGLILSAGNRPASAMEAVWLPDRRTACVAYCRADDASVVVRARGLTMPPAQPDENYDYPIRESALALSPDNIEL